MTDWQPGRGASSTRYLGGLRPAEIARIVAYVFAYCLLLVAVGAVVMFIVFTVAS